LVSVYHRADAVSSNFVRVWIFVAAVGIAIFPKNGQINYILPSAQVYMANAILIKAVCDFHRLFHCQSHKIHLFSLERYLHPTNDWERQKVAFRLYQKAKTEGLQNRFFIDFLAVLR